MAVEADGAPFGKDDTVTAYLVSFLNLLNRVQSCDDNNLLLGANCEEDHPLMKSYSNHLREEMEQIEEKTLTTEIGEQVVFKFEPIPSVDRNALHSFSFVYCSCARVLIVVKFCVHFLCVIVDVTLRNVACI